MLFLFINQCRVCVTVYVVLGNYYDHTGLVVAMDEMDLFKNGECALQYYFIKRRPLRTTETKRLFSVCFDFGNRSLNTILLLFRSRFPFAHTLVKSHLFPTGWPRSNLSYLICSKRGSEFRRADSQCLYKTLAPSTAEFSYASIYINYMSGELPRDTYILVG